MARIAQSASGGQVGEDPGVVHLGRNKKVLKYELQDFDAVRTGLEPVTPCVTGMYSNQLN